jgi:hypothetical protein
MVSSVIYLYIMIKRYSADYRLNGKRSIAGGAESFKPARPGVREVASVENKYGMVAIIPVAIRT